MLLLDAHVARLRPQSTLAVLLSLFLLSACGGGGGETSEPAMDVPTVTSDGSVTSSMIPTVGDTDVIGDGPTDESEETDSTASEPEDNDSTSSEPEENDSTASDPGPIVRAPADAQILLSETLEINGDVSFNSLPLESPTFEWKKNVGPGWANFANNQLARTSVVFDQAGEYQLQLTATNGSQSGFDTMQVTVTSDVINQAPLVDAGTDATLQINEVLTLSAQVSDDGLPMGLLMQQWTKLSGPGEVTFGEVGAVETTATFSAPGVYVLQLSSDDGDLLGNDSITVTVNSTPVVPGGSNINASNTWQNVSTSNGSKPQARHEAGAVAFQNQLYLMGGRSKRQVNRYNPSNNRWENLGTPSQEFSHFQPVVYGGKIYVLGSLDCCFPSESVIAGIKIFNPSTKTWSQGASLPQNRRRGSAGTVVYDNKIYMVGGSTNGHDGGMVNWFDEYNPANNTWRTLPNAPNQRDHFTAAMVGSKLVAAGGRKTDHPNTFSNLVAGVDIYNFDTGNWQSGAPIKTKRAGAMTVSYGEEIIVIGGESDRGVPALATVEAYNVNTNKWRSLNSLRTPRHSGGAAIIDGAIHVVSGNTTTGGGNETQSHERLKLD